MTHTTCIDDLELRRVSLYDIHIFSMCYKRIVEHRKCETALLTSSQPRYNGIPRFRSLLSVIDLKAGVFLPHILAKPSSDKCQLTPSSTPLERPMSCIVMCFFPIFQPRARCYWHEQHNGRRSFFLHQASMLLLVPTCHHLQQVTSSRAS